MKKWLAVLLMVSFAAGIAVAEDKAPWWKLGFGKDKEPVVEQQRPPRGPRPNAPDMQQRRRSQLSEKQRAEMKANFQAMHKLAEAARNEADPAKKAELTAQLRAKLTEGADRMQEGFRKRIEKAEAEIQKMRKRLEEGELNKEKRIDDQLQKLLSGENPERKGGAKKQHRKDKPVE